MPALVDTTLRLLSEEPLGGRVGPARLFELAEVLDRAGFELLEVSGGGCFDHLVRRGVESPWERIRVLRARCRTPLGIALRGRLLVGTRPVAPDLVRRFVSSAAESGIDVFRIHDPMNDIGALSEAAAAVAEAGCELVVGLIHNPVPEGDMADLVEKAKRLGELGASRAVVDDPAGSLDAHHALELVEQVREASGLPVGLYTQGAAGRALAAAIEAARGGASHIAVSIYPVAITLYRPSAEALAQTLTGLGMGTGLDLEAVWQACELVDEALELPTGNPMSPRVAVRAARHGIPAGIVGDIERSLRAQGVGDRLDEVLAELAYVREAAGWPPLVAPIGQILASQALVNVLAARRWAVLVDDLPSLVDGSYGSPPRPVAADLVRALDLRAEGSDEQPVAALDALREDAGALAASEEELLLLALFGADAEPLLRAIRARAAGEPLESEVERGTADRIRELIEIVQESGIGEVTIEEGETRVTVRRSDERPVVVGAPTIPLPGEQVEPVDEPVGSPPEIGIVRVESPMVGTFYRAPQPGAPPFVEVGDAVEPGQTLCILEAMKLMNELQAETAGVVRGICVENADAVEYGQLLFELEPLRGRPDAL